MAPRVGKREPVVVAGQAFGVQLTLEAPDRRAASALIAFLPPAWREDEPGSHPISVRLAMTGGNQYLLERDGEALGSGTLEETAQLCDWVLRHHIARFAPDHTFVHAAAVARDGRAIIVVGRSFSGKTALATALVRAGATYYSDEYAALDAEGLVHPYAKPLALRDRHDHRRKTSHGVSQFGGLAGSEPAPIGLVVVTQYSIGAQWQPTELSPSEAVLELMPHTYPIAERMQPSIAALGKAVARATTLKGDRGDAATVADDLLSRLGATAPPAG